MERGIANKLAKRLIVGRTSSLIEQAEIQDRWNING